MNDASTSNHARTSLHPHREAALAFAAGLALCKEGRGDAAMAELKLRTLGLRSALRYEPGGHFLDPSLPVDVVE